MMNSSSLSSLQDFSVKVVLKTVVKVLAVSCTVQIVSWTVIQFTLEHAHTKKQAPEPSHQNKQQKNTPYID